VQSSVNWYILSLFIHTNEPSTKMYKAVGVLGCSYFPSFIFVAYFLPLKQYLRSMRLACVRVRATVHPCICLGFRVFLLVHFWNRLSVFRRIRKIAKSDSSHRHVTRPSFRQHETSLLSQGGFSSNLIFYCFTKNLPRNPQVSVKSDENSGYCTWSPTYIWSADIYWPCIIVITEE